MDGIHISLAAETIGHIGDFPITNTLITSWIVMALLILFGAVLGKKMSLIPSRMQTLVEWMFEAIHDFIGSTLENRKIAKIVFPVLLTLFLFIAVSNAVEFTPGIGSVGFYRAAEHAAQPLQAAHDTAGETTEAPSVHEGVAEAAVEGAEIEAAMGHTSTGEAHETQAHGDTEFVPLFRSVNTDLNVTLALTIITVIMIEIMGIIALGFFRYAGKFINFSSPLNFIVGLIELVSEISRLISFSFRLFGNIFAGEVLLAVAAFFVPYVLPVPLMAFETFVGFVQAAVFALLALFFIKMAIAEPHAAHAEAHSH